MAFRWACPLIPTSFNSLVVKLATKPLQPTSTGRTFTFHPRSSASAAKSAYRNRFLSNASSVASSHGTVSSTIKTCRQDLDQRTRSGRRLVTGISGGKVSLWLKSTRISQSWARFSGHKSGDDRLVERFSPSRTKDVSWWKVVWASRGMALTVTLLLSSVTARHFSTWLWRQVYLPYVRLVLQPARMCFRVPGARHWRQAGSSPNQRCRLVGEGRTSYVALMVKLNMESNMFSSQLAPSDLPPLHTFLSHTAALLGLGHRSGTSVHFLLASPG